MISLTLRPDLGGRLDQLRDHRTGHEWLWHPSTYKAESRSLPLGSSFDEHWTGGWDEIFPNDAAGTFRQWQLVDHGELWSQPWTIEKHHTNQVILSYQAQTVPVKIKKTIQLDPDQPLFRMIYRFENYSDTTIPFLFKQHAAIAIEPGDKILLPDCLIEPVDLGFSQWIGRAEKTHFPKAWNAQEQEIDLQSIPPRSPELKEFYYCSELATGYCGIQNSRSQSSLIMQFDQSDFPYVWVFQSYGGWRDHYVLVMEPATTIPYDLEVASHNGTIAQLEPYAIQDRVLTVRLEQTDA